MKLRAAVVVILVAIIGIASHISWSPKRVDASNELRQAYRASGNVDYAGIVTITAFYCGRDHSTTSRVRRMGPNERIDYISGPVNGVTILTAGRETRAYRPAEKTVTISRRASAQVNGTSLDLLLKNYNASEAGQGTVAGRPVVIVDLTPKREGNPSKRLWIDRTSKVILRCEDRSPGGEIRTRMEFAEIKYSPHLTKAAFLEPAEVDRSWTRSPGDKEVTRAQVEKAVGIPVEAPSYVPAGYKLESVTVYSCGCSCGHKAAHLRYTNGLNSVSVFETPAHTRCGCAKCMVRCPEGGKCETRDFSQAHLVMVSSGGRSTVVVSDLPQDEMEKVAKSVR